MSGPKYSRAQIRELQRLQQLEKELADRLENAKRNQVLFEIKKLEKECKNCCDNINFSSYDKLIKDMESVIPDSNTLMELKKNVSFIKDNRELTGNLKGNSDELLKEQQALQTKSEKLKNSVSLIKDLKNQLIAEGNEAIQNKRFEEFMSTEWKDTGEKINLIPKDLQELYYEVVGLLSEMPDYEKNKQFIDDTIMKTGDISYKKKQLELRKDAIVVEMNSSQNNIVILDKTCELNGLYTLLGWEAKEIPESIEELDDAIKEAKEELEQQQKSKYIAECIHKVFAQKGYSLIEDSVVSNPNGKIKKDYFEFGEDSLINVSMSDKGQMLFEVVGSGSPDEMDDSRASKLEGEMRRFCPNYAEIKEELEKNYGISLENEQLCEPDKKYAKAVDIGSKNSNRRAGSQKKAMHFED